MKPTFQQRLSCLLLLLLACATPAYAQSEKRIALVVGNAAYQAAPLATAANDAGLIAQTLQAAGFDVSGARDLDGESLRAAFRDFLDKVQASGPDTVAFVYLAGYGLQLDGENYFAPVDARIASAQDVAAEALRVSDYTRRLSSLPLKASFIVLDAARESPFAKSGPPLAGGLALTNAEPNMLMAFNAAPGTLAPAENGPYGVYARALTEMMREGGLLPSDMFDGVRLRVNEETKGAQVPWDESRLSASIVFFERASNAPPPTFAINRIDAMRQQPLRDLGARDAYAAAVERDTLQGYEDFIESYPDDPLASRVRALLAARREALTWRRTCRIGTPDAYWSYLMRYPRGPHAPDARWRLDALAAAMEPPPSFSPIAYDVPPPPPAEIVYVDRPALVFDDPAFGFVPPPPVVFLAPPPAYLVFPPPPPPEGEFVLPTPVFVPVPAYIDPPPYVAPPPGNVIFTNIHNTTIVNNTSIDNTSISAPGAGGGAAAGVAAGLAAGAAAGAIATRVALPPSLARKASTAAGQGAAGAISPQPSPQPGPGAPAGAPAAIPGAHMPVGHELPGMAGRPLAPAGQKPLGQTLPAATGQPGPGPGQKPGLLGGQPPAGHALPGTNGGPSPGVPGTKPGTAIGQSPSSQVPPAAHGQPQVATPAKLAPSAPLQPHLAAPGAAGPPQNAPGAGLRNKLPLAPALGGSKGSMPLTGGNGTLAKPAVSLPPAGPPARQPQNQRPAHEVPLQNHPAPSGWNGGPAGGHVPAASPRPQPPQPQQQSYRPPAPPPQAYRPPPQQQQSYHPPQPAQQTYRPPQQAFHPQPPPQQAYRPPQQAQQRQPAAAKQEPACGRPGLPPCPHN